MLISRLIILEMQLSMNADDDLDLGGEECLRLTAAHRPLQALAYHAHVTARIPVHCLIRQIQALPINKYKLACLGIVYSLKDQEKRFFYISQLHVGIIHRPL